MGRDDGCVKTALIAAFMMDKPRLIKVIATAERMLRRTTYGNTERAITAEDLVQGLVADALCGTRTWDMDKMPGFDGWIITQLRSERYNLVHNQVHHTSLEKELYEKGIDIPGSLDHVKLYENSEFVERLKSMLKQDGVEYSVLAGMLQDMTNDQIASNLMLHPSEVLNAKKRIKRKGDKLLKGTRKSG